MYLYENMDYSLIVIFIIILIAHFNFVKKEIKKRGVLFVAINHLKWIFALLEMLFGLVIMFILADYLESKGYYQWVSVIIFPLVMVLMSVTSKVFFYYEKKYDKLEH